MVIEIREHALRIVEIRKESTRVEIREVGRSVQTHVLIISIVIDPIVVEMTDVQRWHIWHHWSDWML